MTIILFLIDTSASMNQRAHYNGTQTLLDVAKSAVEIFFKTRQKSFESRGDRYMLLDYEDPPAHIKAGWKENLATFMNELRNLECNGLTVAGSALKNAFDLLNLNRMQTGIDTYGQGRSPFYLEPSVIIVITDGGKLLSGNKVADDLNLPMHSLIVGSELTREPFRWDQRLFALVLRMTGTPSVADLNGGGCGPLKSDLSSIDAMCEVTGGRSYCVNSKASLNQSIENLCQKLNSGVVIHFEKWGAEPDEIPGVYAAMDEPDDGRSSPNSQLKSNNWQSVRRMIYVPRSAPKGFSLGYWPIPESFWPDLLLPSLPPRSAHPVIKFSCSNQEPLIIDNLPFDKYELEPSPLTKFILARKQPNICWHVFVANSFKSNEIIHPFGYLKASTNLTCVNLFVMPYNYPCLLPLLDDLFKLHRLKPTATWRSSFQTYLKTMPAYYAGPLRRALTRMGVPNALMQTLIPEQTENSLSFSLVNYLKKIKNIAKVEFDRVCSDVQVRLALKQQQQQQLQQSFMPNSNLNSSAALITRVPFKQDSHDEQGTDFSGFTVGIELKKIPSIRNYATLNNYRNPFDIDRSNLEMNVKKMRQNFLQNNAAKIKLFDDNVLHSIPIHQMGNYQEYLKRQAPPLREIESVPVRQHMFGNPFKIDKRMMMMVDEADIDNNSSSSSSISSELTHQNLAKLTFGSKLGPGGATPTMWPKRKPGPLPRDYKLQKRNLDCADSRADTFDSDDTSDTCSDICENVIKSSLSYERMANNFENTNLAAMVAAAAAPDNCPTEKPPYELEYDSNSTVELKAGVLSELPAAAGSSALVSGQRAARNPLKRKRAAAKKKKKSLSSSSSSSSKRAKLMKKVIKEYLSLQQIKNHNNGVRGAVFRLIRRPGQDFTLLFEQLKLLKGELETQLDYIDQIIVESKKFKRKNLTGLLEKVKSNLNSKTKKKPAKIN